MFGKNKAVTFVGSHDDLISLHPEKQFKKKTKVLLPQGYHLITLSNDGSAELIKNQYEVLLKEPAVYLYFVKSHQGVHKTKWGTRNRIQVSASDGSSLMLGGFGSIEWTIKNPMKLITRRLNNTTSIDVSVITKMVLDKVPDVFLEVIKTESSFDPKAINTHIRTLKPLFKERMNHYLNESGIEISDAIIENINLQPSESEVL